MAEFNLETIIKSGVKEALNEPFMGGKSITEWMAIGMNAPRWINVEDMLPDDAKDYIICILAGDGTKYVTTGTYDRQYKLWHDKIGIVWVPDRVICWCPLPEPPEEVIMDATD